MDHTLTPPRFLQMAPMILGGFIEADMRLRAHEDVVRRRNRLQQQSELWRRYEQEFEDVADDRKKPPSSPSIRKT